MVSRLVVIRHAKAKSEGYAEDSLKPLSEEGVIVQEIMSKKLKEIGIVPSFIYSSPLLRAKQTAQILADLFALSFEEEIALGNDFNQEILIKKITPSEKNQTIIFVGHAPTLAQFVNDLVGRNALPEGLSKSGAVIIEFDSKIDFGEGELKGYYKPD